MKAYTDLEQSKKLAEILPLESADIYWSTTLNTPVPYLATKLEYKMYKEGANLIPCWSLAALLNYLREIDFFPDIKADEYSVTMNINYYNEEEARLLAPVHNIKVEAETFVDACYGMILKLHKLNLL